MEMSRRKFLALGTAAAGISAAGYPFMVEPHWLETRRVDVPLFDDAPGDPLRLLHMSDFHCTSEGSLGIIRDAVEAGIRLAPDLICLTGDFVTAGQPTDWPDYASILDRLPAAAPTYAVLGNHDGGLWSRTYEEGSGTVTVIRFLNQVGITVLHNDSALVEARGKRCRLAGTGDLWSGECDPPAAFAALPHDPAIPSILLAHNPDTKDIVQDLPWDLMLSGHTHGGQIVLPLFGPPFVPVRDRRFVAGLYSWAGRHLHVSRGIGSLLSVRLNCRPEITLLQIT